MESNQIMMKEKLECFGIIKEAFKLFFKNRNFIILFLTTFFPFFCFFLLHELVLQHNFIQALNFITHISPPCGDFGLCYRWEPIDYILQLVKNVSAKHIFSPLIFLGLVYLIDLLNTIMTVYTASVVYVDGQNPITVKEILRRTMNKVSFRGPLVTSIYALLLASVTLIGLLSLSINFYVSPATFFKLLFAVLFIALLAKYIEWSAIWNMGVVISILEENKHGDVALGVSAYISRGSRKRGFMLQSMFFAWSFALRILCMFIRWHQGGFENGVEVTAAQVCLDCFCNVIKWVAFMIYFYDCKKRFLQKKFDGAAGRA